MVIFLFCRVCASCFVFRAPCSAVLNAAFCVV